MSKPLTVTLGRVSTIPVPHELDAAGLRRALEAKGYDDLTLRGVEPLGLRADELHLRIEPDAEFLVVFAKGLEGAWGRRDGGPITVFLDDGILEFTAIFRRMTASSRIGYLGATKRVEVPPELLIGLWRAFVEELRAASTAAHGI